jgi:hypothetical protein
MTDAAPKWQIWLLRDSALRTYWLVNVAVIGAIAAWVFSDGRFTEAVYSARANAQSLARLEIPTASREREIVVRVRALDCLIVLAVFSTLGITAGLFVGARAHRRLRSWLAFTVLVAIWLTVWQTWPELSWQGQAFRLRRQLGDFQNIAGQLRNDWPARDDGRSYLGPFMAYPISDPSVLLMLTQPELPTSDLSFATIQRSASGALRFQLTGNEAGAWLEWHPAGELPSSFVSGLEEQRRLRRFAKLADSWFLVRYN